MTLLTPQQLHDYQKECVLHMLYHNDSMLWVGLGLGKTPITLTTIVDRMKAGQVKKTLVVGPLRVIQAVWHREARKWSHTEHLRFSTMHGSEQQRERALFADADIYLVNYENMNWLAQLLLHYYISQDKPLPFEMVVYDEVSKLKNSTSKRMAGGKRDRKDKWGATHEVKLVGWRKIIPHFKYRTGLTGTPASNGYMDLHGQYLAVDNGERLGPFVTHFRDSYFASDYMGWTYKPTELGKQFIEEKISDITKKMDAKDYLDLPDCKVTNIMVDLPPKARKAYEEVEADMFTQLDNGSEIEVFSRSSVSNKSLQFCNGSPYLSPESSEYEVLHDAKLDALEDILEEAAGTPVLCSYTFKADADRIMKRFKSYKPVNLTETPANQTEQVINDWNSGKLRLIVGHPACLHPDTEVLTERRGWVALKDVESHERVFDGVEFVNHSGYAYSGYKDVIDVFGITMTPDHKLLIADEWVDASNITEADRIKGAYSYDKQSSKLVPAVRFSRNKSNTNTGKCHVGDLVDCGPRHRFIIRNGEGQVFISHNSMGHGIDGLQESGNILVWFGLNWSLELYEQMNGRINRQGQKRPVSILRILCNDTVDLAVADALERKTDDQEGLKSALQRYRDGHTDNNLTVNFW